MPDIEFELTSPDLLVGAACVAIIVGVSLRAAAGVPRATMACGLPPPTVSTARHVEESP